MLATDAFAQNSTVSLQYHFLEDSKLKDPIEGLEGSEDVKFAIGSVDFSARLPFWGSDTGAEAPLNPSQAVGMYVSFQRKFVEEELFTQDRQSDDLFAIGAQLRYFASITSSWGWAVVGGTRLPVSKVEKAQPRDLTYQAGGVIRYSTWANGTIGVGVLFSQHTGDSFVLPLLHTDLNWFSGRLNLEIAPWDPIEPRASLLYRPSPVWSVGAGAVLSGDLYALTGNVDLSNVLPKTARTPGLAMSELLVGPEFRVHSGMLELVFIGGVALRRRFEFRAIDEDETIRIPTDGSTHVPAEFDLESVGTLLVRGAYLF
jgi:hypothetical protein